MIKIIPSDTSLWYKDKGDENLRLNYNLNKDSIVVDIGARHGNWCDRIYEKYSSKIYCFEVVELFCKELLNKGYKVYNKAVLDKNEKVKIGIEQGEGSIFHENNQFEVDSIKASDIFNMIGQKNIDLLKINVEGAEYLILENLIKNNLIKNIKNLQIQFHIIEGHEEKYDDIVKFLSKTHNISWRYPFVWENWEIKIN